MPINHKFHLFAILQIGEINSPVSKFHLSAFLQIGEILRLVPKSWCKHPESDVANMQSVKRMTFLDIVPTFLLSLHRGAVDAIGDKTSAM